MQVNGTAAPTPYEKAKIELKNRARAQAGIAIQAATGLDGITALKVVDVCMRTLQRFGMVTVGAAELDKVGQSVEMMQFALVQAYVHIDVTEGDLLPEREEHEKRVLGLIEQALGGKPRKVTEPAIEPAPDSSQH